VGLINGLMFNRRSTCLQGLLEDRLVVALEEAMHGMGLINISI